MKTPAQTARRESLDRHIRRNAAEHRAYMANADRAEHGGSERDPAPLTAGFDRSHAERLGPGCYRVLAAPMHS